MANSEDAPTASLFNNPLLSDVTIRQTCNGHTKEYHAHKAILCNRSQWFLKAFTGNFKEATDKVIELHDDNATNFQIMLKYIYTGKYAIPQKKLGPEGSFHSFFIEPIGVYRVAHKYECKELKEIAALRLSDGPKVAPGPDQAMRIVGCHYEDCAEPDCAMGCAIAAYFLKLNLEFKGTGLFLDAVKKHPEFARDVVLMCNKNTLKLKQGE